MRLWHKKLIGCLPRQQLIGQWRELNAMYKQLQSKGKVTHRLVSYLNDDLESFWKYSRLVLMEMFVRGYKTKDCEFKSIILKRTSLKDDFTKTFKEHNDKYLMQCISNLEEKHDRGIIEDFEWENIMKHTRDLIKQYGKNLFKEYLQTHEIILK